jgi:L-2-hydroxyglutarate oxidase LhgO
MRLEFDVAIVGAGAVGLAVAALLAHRGRSVVILEHEAGIARGTTSRNSQVLHAGLYYPEDSWKARLCVAGRARLVERCIRLGIPYRLLGKLVVAVAAAEIPALERIHALGTANGAPGLELLEAIAVRRLEPALRSRAALHSPATGIIDAHALCVSWLAEAEAHGAVVALRHEVVALEHERTGWRVGVLEPDGARVDLCCAAVVNAAGLGSDRIAALAGIDVDACGWRQHPCKGDWFAVAPGAPLRVERLVYPVPSGAGLGVHVTLDLGGRMRLGPDAEYVDAIRYDVDAAKATAFARAAGRYLPGLRAEWLTPDQAGIRPKLAAPGEVFRDFVVEEGSAHGRPGLVNLIGIESPGLTAAPAIAERVVELLSGL